MPSEKPEGNASEESTAQTDSLSVSDVAKMVPCTAQAVRMAYRKGRLRRDPRGPAAPPRFSLQEVERWISFREMKRKDRDAITIREEGELAKVESVTAIVEANTKHTEQAWSDTRASYIESRKSFDSITSAQDRYIERLLNRIKDLEEREDEILAALATLQQKKYDDMVADFGAEERKTKLAAAMKAATPFVGAAIARLIGGEQAQQGAFMQLVESLSDDQRDAFMQAAGTILTQSQAGSLMLLFSQWSAKVSKQEETPRTRKSDPPPPPPPNEPKQAA